MILRAYADTPLSAAAMHAPCRHLRRSAAMLLAYAAAFADAFAAPPCCRHFIIDTFHCHQRACATFTLLPLCFRARDALLISLAVF